MSTSTGRVGIVTIIDHDNFGNRLQNFALQHALASRGWQVETIRNTPRPMRRSLVAARAVAAARTDGVLAVARRHARLAVDRVRASSTSIVAPAPRPSTRRAAIRAFTRTHIHELDTDFDDCGPGELAARYDRVVVGSDQVWNPGFRQANEVDFLTFVPGERRVAYAASFGVADVPTYLRPRYARWLAGIPRISVREERGARIVHELVGREVPVVVDPTLLVEPSLWHESAPVPRALRGRRYVATFFLGGMPADDAQAVVTHARAEGQEVIDLLDPDDPELVAMSPLDFVGAIRGAELLATDSFHASVFSLVFARPSLTRARHEDDTRLLTLFGHAGVARHPWQGTGLMITDPLDPAQVDHHLAGARVASWAYLDDALGPAPGGEHR